MVSGKKLDRPIQQADPPIVVGHDNKLERLNGGRIVRELLDSIKKVTEIPAAFLFIACPGCGPIAYRAFLMVLFDGPLVALLGDCDVRLQGGLRWFARAPLLRRGEPQDHIRDDRPTHRERHAEKPCG